MYLWHVIIVTFAIVVSSCNALKVVYTRAYAGKDLGNARQYHAQYFYIARKVSYYTLKQWSSHFRCANYEANELGDYMGFFHCDQWFEPSNFDYCCGQQGAHYCCPNSSLATPYLSDPDPQFLQAWLVAVIIVSIIIFVLPLFGVAIYCCIAICCLAKASKRPNTAQTAPAPSVTYSSGVYPVQQTTGGYPMQQPSGNYFQEYQPQGTVMMNYNQPSDFGYASAPDTQQPPPSYVSVVQK